MKSSGRANTVRKPSALGGGAKDAHPPAESPASGNDLSGVVEALREGDGVDPREEAKRSTRLRRQNRSGLEQRRHRHERFIGQVQNTIDFALQMAASPVLNSLVVREVLDQGGSLLVVVAPRDPDLPLDTVEAGQALEQASSMFSRELAREITRKECPKISFVVLPASARKLED